MAGAPQLKVFLAGRVAVQLDGMRVEEERFPGRQGRLLFAYLVAEQGRAVPRDQLAEALWGDAPPATWDKALTVLVSKLRGDRCARALPREWLPPTDAGPRRRRESRRGAPRVRALPAASRRRTRDV